MKPAFGYIPQKKAWKDLLVRCIGIPHPYGRMRAMRVLKYLSRKHKKILDVGSGEGIWSVELARRGFDVTGIDLSATAVENAKKAVQRTKTKADFYVGDAQHIKLKEKNFDQAICLDVMEHVDDPTQVIKGVSKHLRKGGIFIATVPTPLYLVKSLLPLNFKKHCKKIGHIHDGFYFDTMKKMFNKEGFKIIKHEYFGRGFSRIILELLYACAGHGQLQRYRKKMYDYHYSTLLLFFLIYPILLTDYLFPRKSKGAFVLLKAVKL